MQFVLDEFEVGRRAAIYLSNEAEGFGAWVDPAIFSPEHDPVTLNGDWHSHPLAHIDPDKIVRHPAGTPVFIPQQRKAPGRSQGVPKT